VSVERAKPARPILPRVSIIGLGLMGGSLALALRHAGVAGHIVGCGRPALLARARELGAIDSGAVDAGAAVAGSDFVFLCVPVETSIALLAQIAPHLPERALVSDVGSTKQAFAAAARTIFGASAGERVLPGHPLAGRELSGLEHASADLFANCVWVLTPIAAAMHAQPPRPEQASWSAACADLTAAQRNLQLALEAIGARVVFSTSEEHDRTLAYTSHLPQMLSTALALTLERAFGADNPALQVHAGGLRAMLRLAGSDPAMWEQVAASNRENLSEALERMEAELRKLRESLGSAEFRARFEQAREFAKFMKS
jgi:prephenate dehydrogenase